MGEIEELIGSLAQAIVMEDAPLFKLTSGIEKYTFSNALLEKGVLCQERGLRVLRCNEDNEQPVLDEGVFFANRAHAEVFVGQLRTYFPGGEFRLQHLGAQKDYL